MKRETTDYHRYRHTDTQTHIHTTHNIYTHKHTYGTRIHTQYTHIHAYIHTYMLTHTYTHTYTHTEKQQRDWAD